MRMVQVDRNGLEVLGREECLRLLGTATVGRVGLSSGALPTVLPVSFKLDGDRILVRTGRGTKLEAAARNAVVAFEVDNFDLVDHSGWSVVVTGVARQLDDPAELDALPAVPRWARSGESSVIAISTELVSGRRLTTGGPLVPSGADQRH